LKIQRKISFQCIPKGSRPLQARENIQQTLSAAEGVKEYGLASVVESFFEGV